MIAKKYRPRYSLRTLLTLTFLSAVVLQATLAARQRERDERRAALLADVREQVLFSQRMQPTFQPRMLNYIERRVTTSPEAALLLPRERLQIVQQLASERQRHSKLVTAPSPVSAPDMEQLAIADDAACPW